MMFLCERKRVSTFGRFATTLFTIGYRIGMVSESNNHIQPIILIKAMGMIGGASLGNIASVATIMVVKLKNTMGRILLP